MTRITSGMLQEATGVEVPEALVFDSLALVSMRKPNSLTFIDQARFLPELAANKYITGCLITADLADEYEGAFKIVCDDPRFSFYTLMNHVAVKAYQLTPSRISPDAVIHRTAFISPENVEIGARVIIEPNVTVLADVEISEDCILRAGTVVGSEGFEQKRTTRGILPVRHTGRVVIGPKVEVGAGTCIDKGLYYRDTMIGEESKIDNLVHIGHCAHIGRRCLIAAKAMIGAVDMGNDVWIGPSANLLGGLKIGEGASVSVGAVVTKNVGPGERVTGNFAIEHTKFITNLKDSVSR